jgi:hypothetical protein
MVESAAVRDISEASIYPGASVATFDPIIPLLALDVYRVRDPEALPQNRLLCLVRYSLSRCVAHHFCCYDWLMHISPLSSRPCALARGSAQPCSSASCPVEGWQEGQPCCRRGRGGEAEGCCGRCCARRMNSDLRSLSCMCTSILLQLAQPLSRG